MSSTAVHKLRVGPKTSREEEELAAYAAGDRQPGRESIEALARWLGRSSNTVDAWLRGVRPRARRRHNLTGVMIDDFGLTHAQILDQMRKGLR